MGRHRGRLGADRLGRHWDRAGLTNMMQGRCGGKNGLGRSAGTQEENRANRKPKPRKHN